MQRLERLFAIAELIRRESPRPVSAARLAAEFDVSRRTIERDLDALRASGLPLFAERGRNGGHVALDSQSKVVVALSVSEIASLLVATKVAGPGAPWSGAAERAMAQLLDGLMGETRASVEELRRTVRVQERTDGPVSGTIKRTLETAVERGRVVDLSYEAAGGEVTERLVDAVGFYEGNGGWFLIGWCHLREDGRIFRLDRIRSARLTKRKRQRAADVDEALGWVPQAVASP